MSQAGKAGCNGYQLVMRHPCQPEVIGSCLSLVLLTILTQTMLQQQWRSIKERERESTGALGDISPHDERALKSRFLHMMRASMGTLSRGWEGSQWQGFTKVWAHFRSAFSAAAAAVATSRCRRQMQNPHCSSQFSPIQTSIRSQCTNDEMMWGATREVRSLMYRFWCHFTIDRL